MTQSSMADKVLEILQQCEAEWKLNLQAAEKRIRELEEENERLRKLPPEQRTILDEITDAALRKRLEPFVHVESLPLDTLIREAGVVLEDRLRTASQADTRLVGVDLVDAALKPPEPIIRFSAHPGEQEGVRMLYRGAIQFIRNPPMHRAIQYAESTARLFLHLIDSLLLLLSEHEPAQPERTSLEEKYEYIANIPSRERARRLVAEVCGWYPDQVSAVPIRYDISLRAFGRVFAVLNPGRAHFNLYTYDRSRMWTRFRIDNDAHVRAIQPILRENVESLLSGGRLSQGHTLEARYSRIQDPTAQALARQFVDEIQSWEPERISTKPMADSISMQSSGGVFASVVPRSNFFNVYIQDDAGRRTRYRIDNESDVAAVLPLVLAKFESSLPAHVRSQVRVREKERRGQPQWDEATFLQDLEVRRGSEEAAAAREILDWMKAKKLAIRWGRGKTVGTFYLALKDESGNSVFGLWSHGSVELHLGYLQRFPPFDGEGKRAEWVERLNAIPGVRVPDTETGQFPSFNLSALTNAKALQGFFQAVDWVLEEISQAAGQGRSERV
jgi:hypothetical protein